MPTFSEFIKKAWIGDSGYDADPAFIISRDSVTINLSRDGVTVGNQTFRVAPFSSRQSGEERTQRNNVAGQNQVYLIGETGVDVAAGDRFRYPDEAGGSRYRVVFVDKTMPNKVEARCEGVQ